MQESTATKNSEVGSPVIPPGRNVGIETAYTKIGTQENKKVTDAYARGVCPGCGAPLRFGSRDPCEGDFYWCSGCGDGPILFPLYHRMPRVITQQPIIDAEQANAALVMVEQLRGRA